MSLTDCVHLFDVRVFHDYLFDLCPLPLVSEVQVGHEGCLESTWSAGVTLVSNLRT